MCPLQIPSLKDDQEGSENAVSGYFAQILENFPMPLQDILSLSVPLFRKSLQLSECDKLMEKSYQV